MRKLRLLLISWLASGLDNPMIYTIKGNIPISLLRRHVEWKFSPTQVTLIEKYTDSMGEVVKDGCDVFILPSKMTIQMTEGNLNG
jgi:hypothetical protein